MRTVRIIVAACAIAVGVAGLVGFGATPAQAAILNVTTTDTTYDGVCDDHCSLWDAVYTANGLPGTHTVFLPAGSYRATSGPVTIWSDLTLRAVGGQVTLDADGAGRALKVLAAGAATLDGVRIIGGRVSDGGAGVLNEGTLVLRNSEVAASGSTLGCGGGLLNSGSAMLVSSSISANSAPNGAGICNGPGATLTLVDSATDLNQATGKGGGIYNFHGTVELRGAAVADNKAVDGAGIFNDGELEVLNSRLVGNEALGGDGGGLFNLESTSISQTEIAGNRASSGGGIQNRFLLDVELTTVRDNHALFGGGISNSSILRVSRSTFAENTATVGDGGGLNSYANADASIVDSTVSGNSAGNEGGGISQSAAQVLTVTDSTIVGNVANADSSNGGRGGGLFTTNAGTLLTNSILAGNENHPGTGLSPDCFGTLGSGDHNIVGDLDGCQLTLLEHDNTGMPRLGPLADNGGPTPTHALLGGGAVDHGPTDASCIGTDQRGVPRVSPCDTGAYELVRCGSVPVNVVGTLASDSLAGTGKPDAILALGGADRVTGRGGDDRICGGDGRDRLSGGKGNDVLIGGRGNDQCLGGPGRNRKVSC